MERLILCVIKGTIIAAISLSWILSRSVRSIPPAFQCLLDALCHSRCGGSCCSARSCRLNWGVGAPCGILRLLLGTLLRPRSSCIPAAPSRASCSGAWRQLLSMILVVRDAPTQGLGLVSRFESFQTNECALGAIPFGGNCVFEGKSVLSLGLCSAPWKVNRRPANQELLKNIQASSPGSPPTHCSKQ